MKLQAELLPWRIRQGAAIEPAALAAAAARIDRIVTHAAAVVDDLLDVTRMEIGQPLSLERRPVDLAGLVREAASEQQAATEHHSIRLVVTDEALVGEWDATRLRRVVDNLLTNALKFSPEGGEVVVTLGREEAEEKVSAVLTVRDFGIGIPADDLPRIFERFSRGSNVVGRISGTGIGLASARYIVESHGGTIAVESTEGQGTLVSVRLPLGTRPTAELP